MISVVISYTCWTGGPHGDTSIPGLPGFISEFRRSYVLDGLTFLLMHADRSSCIYYIDGNYTNIWQITPNKSGYCCYVAS